MIKTLKREIIFDEANQKQVDETSYLLSCFYNALHTACEDDSYYKEKSPELYKNLLSGRNLRDYSVDLKKRMTCRNTNSVLLKNTALQLATSYNRFLKKISGYPKKKYQNKKWFSLYYCEAYHVKINGNKVSFPLGKDADNKKITANAVFACKYKYEKDTKIKTARIIKDTTNRYYLIQCIEVPDIKVKENLESWISIDMNHKNFFVAVNNKGETFEFLKSNITKYYDKEIDKLKSKISFTKPKSKRYNKLDKSLKNLRYKRKEQIKTYLFTVSNYLCKHYDIIIIGDYTPSNDTATHSNMKRSMLNQEHIGMFRLYLEWTCKKSGKRYVLVNETNTTKECCKTGILTKRMPDIRDWFINVNGVEEKVIRDVNSAVNIARKAGYLTDEHLNWDLSKIDYELSYRYGKKISLRSMRHSVNAECEFGVTAELN